MIRKLLFLGLLFFVVKKLLEQFKHPNTHTEPKTPPKDPFDILGITKQASKEEIKAAFYKKCKENHPDQVAHLSKEIQQKAHDQTQDNLWAYEQLK